MRECIAFQEECSLSKPQKQPNEQDKRVLAQVLENALFNLDKLVNDCLLHTVYELLAKLDENPIKKLRQIGPMGDNIGDQTVIDDEIEKFDVILDQLTQVGSFAVSYASTAKCNYSRQYSVYYKNHSPTTGVINVFFSLHNYSKVKLTKLFGIV